MKIYRSVRSNWKTQGWGENKACIKTDVNRNVVYPVYIFGKKGAFCPVGSMGFYEAMGMKGHNGIDMATWHREPCFFPVIIEGVEWYAKDASDGSGGLGVDVISKTPVTLNGRTDYIKFRSWHLDEVVVPNGTTIKVGQNVGFCGNTGASSGTHLHWNMKWCDKDGNSIDSNNGYYGAFDVDGWYENVFILDKIGSRELLNRSQTLRRITFELRHILHRASLILRQFILIQKKHIEEGRSILSVNIF